MLIAPQHVNNTCLTQVEYLMAKAMNTIDTCFRLRMIMDQQGDMLIIWVDARWWQERAGLKMSWLWAIPTYFYKDANCNENNDTMCLFKTRLAVFWSYSINGCPEDKRLGIVTLLLHLLKEMDSHGLCHHQCAWHWYWIRDTYTIPITDPIWRYPQFASLDHTNSTTCKSFKHIMPRKVSCCKVAYIQRLFWMRLMLSRWCEKVLMSLCMSNL